MRRFAAAAGACALLLAACADEPDDGAGPERVGDTTTSTTVASTPAPTTVPATEPAPRLASARLVQVASASEPTAMAFLPDDPSVAFVAEREGRVWRYVRDGDELRRVDAPLLDLRDRVVSDGSEQGLLGLAVSPDGQWLVIDLIERGGPAGTSVVERYRLDGEHLVDSPPTELFRVDQPFTNHNGGHVVFGPDGMLYVGLGDGGSQGDPSGNGQDLSTPLAKVLRLDASGDDVAIPPDNPFVDDPGARPEIWLYGVRNPWRFSFDRANGDLWVADVGGGEREEIDHLPASAGAGAGANLGWQAREGTAPGDDEIRGSAPIDPVFEYSHDDGCSITGGFVYRGSAMPGLVGDYVFGDFCTATVWALAADGSSRSLGARTDQLASFAEDPNGELYVLSLGGDIRQIVP